MKRPLENRELILGGEPRADLLPPELKARRAGRALHRALTIALVGIVVIMGASIGSVSLKAAINQNDLAAAKMRTDEILMETTTYAEVSQVQDQYNTTLAVRGLGLSTEVDWKSYLADIRLILPADVNIGTVSVTTASPWTAFAQSEVPLMQPRTASLALELTSSGLPTVPQWLVGLRDLPGYADASPGSISRSEDGSYVVSLALNINASALTNRFAVKE
ncbi:hypothetical protein E3O06_07475 [Cryobacterium glaciale]|uniref:Fimbrial assembly protein n=1 Tax=Cryobacterium glaciale TaxID=1259145 RepID=A0A4R8UXU8_9MICO|nr:hypothetical protein [Cryobacterium glaciale]TFB73665.1 hypothetical protein E3O06_07475 [Cryobacterium glaciale]